MNTYLKSMLMIGAIAGLYVPTADAAQKSPGGVTGEARLHPGTWNNQRSSRSMVRSRPMYRGTAPVIVRTERAPSAVAQAPAEERRFSYDPAQPAEVGTPCPGSVTTEPAPATAERSTRTYRSFSYEPSMSDSYSTPRMRSRSTRTPSYLLPKTHPDKYRNH